MATLLNNVDNKTWGLGIGKQGKFCTTFPLRLGEGVAALQLVPGDSTEITIPFPPSVFQGIYAQPRQTPVLNVSE